MALTADMKDELAAVAVSRADDQAAEVASMLRYAGGFQVAGTSLLIDVDFDRPASAQRLAGFVSSLYAIPSEILKMGAASLRPTRYIVRWNKGGTELARRTGLISPSGQPVRGLPPWIINGTKEQCIAAWRGAFLARGSLTEPGRASALEISTPSNEAAVALVGTARRLGVTAKTKEARNAHRVVVRDGEAIGALLTMMGAQATRLTWEEQRMHREVRATANRLANFDDANLQRSVRAAVAAAARVERALALLGDDVPEHLAEAGRLRVKHRQASLEELGHLTDPPMTKDAVAGRVRRLLSMADRRAAELGVPDTNAAVTEDLFTFLYDQDAPERP